MNTSSIWRISVETEETDFAPKGQVDAFRIANELDVGKLSATGSNGDEVELQFNRHGALVLYMTAEGAILRPRFPNHDVSGDATDELFCECCGVQLGDDFSKCTNRENGFVICETILAEKLPQSADIQWIPLRGVGQHETQ